MSKSLLTILLLECSNTFMTIAWYGHLRMAQTPWFSKLGLWAVVLISWSIALLEYCFMVAGQPFGVQGDRRAFFPGGAQGHSGG